MSDYTQQGNTQEVYSGSLHLQQTHIALVLVCVQPHSQAPPSFLSLAVRKVTESWAGPGNEASMCWFLTLQALTCACTYVQFTQCSTFRPHTSYRYILYTWVSLGSMMPLAGCTFKVPGSASAIFHSNLDRRVDSLAAAHYKVNNRFTESDLTEITTDSRLSYCQNQILRSMQNVLKSDYSMKKVEQLELMINSCGRPGLYNTIMYLTGSLEELVTP